MDDGGLDAEGEGDGEPDDDGDGEGAGEDDAVDVGVADGDGDEVIDADGAGVVSARATEDPGPRTMARRTAPATDDLITQVPRGCARRDAERSVARVTGERGLSLQQ